ncbi:hypothetical protein BFW88_14125 [Pseudomonas fluorescens]|uniref:Uncharacterized protein n=1 Tax=Pseudomonas lactucae TaxID=2813360 RepID=A0A9X0YAZ5_9PSED|nr:hypothetical protein [Pseudomonas lactucae]OPA90480.1 hypothetical protein BFW88_14125 [Pseudomonas fluorescens]MBN2975656.1 hypothetical protein [Pseudomonas lactucae]MBN2989021.1 hypothetical protein [Pseudomonas lactucae]OPB09363.1 hypothetical protein BFW92_14315 [Pseudomonas fluorescens]OPB21208.1 hypothetical protein BFW93_14100 [Pseudomonas fluorescens]
MAEATSLAVTGIFSGLQIAATGNAGLVKTACAVSATTGYVLARQLTSDGTAYTVLTATNTQPATDPASLVVEARYAQTISLAELDLEVRYTDIPAGSELSVEAPDSALGISRQAINGTGLVGSQSKKQAAFETSLQLSLWVTNPDQLKATSVVTLSLSSIEGSSGGPVKKTLLQKFQINLSH